MLNRLRPAYWRALGSPTPELRSGEQIILRVQSERCRGESLGWRSIIRGDSTQGWLVLTNQRAIYKHLRLSNLIRPAGELGSVAFELEDVVKVFSDVWNSYWGRFLIRRSSILGFQLRDGQRIWFRVAYPWYVPRALRKLIALGVITEPQ